MTGKPTPATVQNIDQRMVAAPPALQVKATQHPLLRNLTVTGAGYHPLAEAPRRDCLTGASTHLVLLCLRGHGWVASPDGRLEIRAGEIVWIPAGQPHSCGTNATDPWQIVWARFCGTEASVWRAELRWAGQEPIGHVHLGPQRISLLGLDRVYAELEKGCSLENLLAAGVALRSFFCTAHRLLRQASAAKSASERTAVIQKTIMDDPARPYSLKELAFSAGLSVAHFSLLFRHQAGFAPIDFVIRQRIHKACRLLEDPAATVLQVADETGFKDAFYFSRCFRKLVGISPREYRKGRVAAAGSAANLTPPAPRSCSRRVLAGSPT